MANDRIVPGHKLSTLNVTRAYGGKCNRCGKIWRETPDGIEISVERKPGVWESFVFCAKCARNLRTRITTALSKIRRGVL